MALGSFHGRIGGMAEDGQSRGEVWSISIPASSLTLPTFPVTPSSWLATFISEWLIIISVRMALPQLSQQVLPPCCIAVENCESLTQS
jgi:hypothetical protein